MSRRKRCSSIFDRAVAEGRRLSEVGNCLWSLTSVSCGPEGDHGQASVLEGGRFPDNNGKRSRQRRRSMFPAHQNGLTLRGWRSKKNVKVLCTFRAPPVTQPAGRVSDGTRRRRIHDQFVYAVPAQDDGARRRKTVVIQSFYTEGNGEENKRKA